MVAVSFAAAMLGIEGYVVQVEANSATGAPSLSIIGLPDRAIDEARSRVRAAVCNSGFPFPPGRVLVNLSPADIRKGGPAFDLPIALAILALEDQIEPGALQGFIGIGELALDGALRAVGGMLPMVLGAKSAGFTKFIVPAKNAEEALLVEGIDLYPLERLLDAVAVVRGHGAKFRRSRSAPLECSGNTVTLGDFSEVRGQEGAKRALEIAAAGGHNILFIGPPGCGKTMLAQRLPSILPFMNVDEALEVTKIYSVAGLLTNAPGIVRTRPFRFPHHTISRPALVGGGNLAKPGEMSLAHHGVLFLDELPEFSRGTIEVLRQPLEEGNVTIARAAATFSYPARFQLVASMNPCPCGYRGTRTSECRCDDVLVSRYIGKLSGPLLDRIDMQIEIGRVPFDEMIGQRKTESSSVIRARVVAARACQTERFRNLAFKTRKVGAVGFPERASSEGANAAIPPALMATLCPLDAASLHLLSIASAKRQFSARALDRITRLARTIADLASSQNIRTEHVAEAIQYRTLERIAG